MERIEFEADIFSATGLTLLVDGTAQSHVDPDDPTRLFFEYVRRIGHVIDAMGLPGSPLRVLHLGAGAFTLARYLAATGRAPRRSSSSSIPSCSTACSLDCRCRPGRRSRSWSAMRHP